MTRGVYRPPFRRVDYGFSTPERQRGHQQCFPDPFETPLLQHSGSYLRHFVAADMDGECLGLPTASAQATRPFTREACIAQQPSESRRIFMRAQEGWAARGCRRGRRGNVRVGRRIIGPWNPRLHEKCRAVQTAPTTHSIAQGRRDLPKTRTARLGPFGRMRTERVHASMMSVTQAGVAHSMERMGRWWRSGRV